MSIENSFTIDPREKKKFALESTAFRKIMVTLMTWVFKLFMDLKIEGLENLPRKGGAIIAANHVTNFDVFPMQISVPRPIFYMAKESLFNPLTDMALRSVGAFPVKRGEKDIWALNHARKVLDNALVLGMFPEGTRSRGNGLRTAKTGAARLAIEKNVPIIPMAIIGSDKFFREFPKKNTVRVKFCEPIYPEKGENSLVLTDRLMFCLAKNLPAEMRGVYAEAKQWGIESGE
ncbi:MAG: 1-acyl-sn-glycerol-3-phosphate acyltransferase [Chloroflexi bacterium]|nr:1-acyl-sn-glycerol-3-phosphate acyltransferase [Chloroflexota bacterium]